MKVPVGKLATHIDRYSMIADTAIGPRNDVTNAQTWTVSAESPEVGFGAKKRVP